MSGTGGASNTAGNIWDALQFGLGAGSSAGGGPGASSIFGNFGGMFGEGANAFEESVNAINPFSWVQDLFTIGNGARLIAIIMGIILVAVAIIVLVTPTAVSAAKEIKSAIPV